MRQPDSLQTYMHLFQRAGWDPSALVLRKQLQVRTNPESEPMPARLLSLMHDEMAVATLFVLDGVRFPSGMTLYQRFLDMTIEARLGLCAAAQLAPAPFVLIASPYECFLYEAQTEELLLSATTPEDSAERIFSVFKTDGDWLDALDRLPRRNAQQWGKELSDWLRVWSAKLGRSGRVSPDIMKALLAHWLIAWKDMLFQANESLPDLMGIAIDMHSEPAVALAQQPSPAEFYAKHIQKITDRFPFGLFMAYSDREDIFWSNESIAPLLASFLAEARLLSQSKFLSANVLYAYTSENTEQKSWRKSVTETVKIEQWLTRSDLTIHDPVTVTVAEEGFGWGLTLLEDLVRFWLEENLKRKQLYADHGGLGVQLDLFAPPPAGVNSAGVLDDVLAFVVTHCFRAKVPSATERFVLCVLTCLTLYELAEAYSLPLNRFNNMDAIFEQE